MAVARGLGLPAGRLTDAASKHSLCYFSSFSEYMVMHIDIHLQSGGFSIYWLWLLYVSAVSVAIVINAICDMPRQEFSLCEHLYIDNTYMKSRKSCSETGSLKNRNVNHQTSCSYRRNIRWDWREIRTYPQKSLKWFITGNWSICVVCTKSNKITEITYTYCEYTHDRTMRIPV